MRTTNPVLNAKTFANVERVAGTPTMTVEGTVNRSAFLLLILMATATWTWMEAFIGSPIDTYLWTGLLGGLAVGLVTAMLPGIARFTAPLYAALEGLALGAISAIYEARFHGIVVQAVALTFGVLIALLVVYRLHIIPVTDRFK
ncbi:MAG TPA: Bax inhibitor-1/YccA family protein, partial [Gemmatimonadales bacterium]|nr:Bax inhibitor-1/YccA family protein [Gemmatimonadales bacterium]